MEVLGPLFPLLIAAIGGSVAYLVASFRRQSQLAAWRLVAQRIGLCDIVVSSGSLFSGASLEGETGNLHLRLESYRRGKYERGTRIVVSGLGHGSGGLSLRREGLATAFEKNVIGEREIEIGDASFDEQFFIGGQAPMAFAVLGPEERQPLSELLRGGVSAGLGERVSVDASLAGGRLEVRVKESGFSSANRERLPALVERVLQVARPLVVGPDLATRIAANLEREPSDGVRLKGLATLAREFPGHPATRERLRAALVDRSDEVRLRAATALGDEGRDTLLELVARDADDSFVARAVASLGEQLSEEGAGATLRRALAAGVRRETALACLEHLRERGSVASEALALQALRHEDGALAEAAARALGRIGGVAAVGPLLEAGGRDRKGVCRQAIAEIQSRLPGAGAGQLSIAAGEAGALSLADGEPGRLSLAEQPQQQAAASVPPPRARQRQ